MKKKVAVVGFLSAVVLALLTSPAAAHHRPGHGVTTTTVAPTTTTVAPTTTTVAPTTTTTAPGTCDSSAGAPAGSPVSGPTSYTDTGTVTISNRIFDGSHADDLVRVNNGHVIFDHVTFKGVGTGTTGHSLEVKLGGSVEVRNSVFEGDPAEDHFQTEGNDPSQVACSEFRTTPGEDHLDTKPGATVTIENNRFLAAPTAQVLQNHNSTSPVHFLNNSGTGLTRLFYESGQTRGTIVGNTITQTLWLYDVAEILVKDNVLAQVKHGEGSSTRDPVQTYFLNNQINDALNNGGTCYRDGNTGAEPVTWCTTGPPPWY